MGRFDEWFSDDANLASKESEHDSTQRETPAPIEANAGARRNMAIPIRIHSAFWKSNPPPKLIAMIILLIATVALLQMLANQI